MLPGSHAVQVVDRPDEDIVARLRDEITAFNFAAIDIHDGRELFAAIHDEGDELSASVYGWTWGGTCWIELLWVRERDRRRGTGSALLEAVEDEALRRGCTQVALATHSFQGPAFYGRHGFDVTGEVPDYPNGHSYYLMRKALR
jgi:GNAT superfamily N-acetyltransferase